MKTPVIIPAYNEERRIGATLSALPASEVEPTVIVNGSYDATADIARSFGVNVIETERRGKMPAIQLCLREMGSRALEPFILLDADTRPVLPKTWARLLLRGLHPDTANPRALSAPVLFTRNYEDEKSTHITAAARSIYRQVHGTVARIVPGTDPAYYGPNQAYKLATADTLDAILTLDHIWPEEDVAMARVVQEHGGTFTQYLDNRMIVTSPESAAFAPLIDYVRRPDEVHKTVADTYRRSGPPDARPLND